ncbi:hypothetical protein AGMMS4957_05820 [Bacteroidia bacterium]|nr:hypothetical protein AGMMS4957_05820 [Bacteroidia bacterium]
MLLPDNIHPENSVYYNGALVLESLQQGGTKDLFDLFQAVNEKRKISFPIFILCLDWLYLLGVAKLNSEGGILCS